MSIDAVVTALSSSTRREILRLATCDMPLGEVANLVGVSPQTMAHHVSVLRDAGLVAVEQQGTRKFLRVRVDEVRLVLRVGTRRARPGR